jgi:hypothetical protein
MIPTLPYITSLIICIYVRHVVEDLTETYLEDYLHIFTCFWQSYYIGNAAPTMCSYVRDVL